MKTTENKGLFHFLLMFVILAIPAENHGQSIKRQAISSYGGSSIVSDISLSFTAGQSYNTSLVSEDGFKVLKGFQQPLIFAITERDYPEDNMPQFIVYPNPATYSFSIQSLSEVEDFKIRIYDITGQKIYSKEVHKLQKYSVGARNWSNGIYVIRAIGSSGNNTTMKLIINK